MFVFPAIKCKYRFIFFCHHAGFGTSLHINDVARAVASSICDTDVFRHFADKRNIFSLQNIIEK